METKQPQPLTLLVPKSPLQFLPQIEQPERVLTVKLPANSGYPSAAWPLLSEDEELEWLAQNLSALLVSGQKAKHHIIEREKLARKITESSFVPNTPELLLAEVVKRGEVMAKERHWLNPFALTTWNEAIYRVLSYYFSGSELFETEGPGLLGLDEGAFSLHKGLIIAGPTGVGKSDMLELFARNPYKPYHFVSCVEMENDYSKKDGGPNVIDQYSGLIVADSTSKYYGHSHLGVCFDDFGAEGDAVHMGKRINMMDMLLQTRYRTCRGPYTHLTTNASQAQIQKAYDGRVYDRMIQMFNLIEYDENAPSLRI